MTVTVVVIMFELTGALTYILPTMVSCLYSMSQPADDKYMQIVLLATKAVGDFLGTSGIAEEAIRFNGFPFLDKDDHAYNVPGECPCILQALPDLTNDLSFTSDEE